MSRFQTCSKMITLLGIRKNVILKVIILQVLIAIPVLYIIKDALLTRVNIDGKDALHVPIVFGTTNITRVTANVTLSSQNGHVAMSQDIYTTAESLNAFIVNNTSGLVLHRDSSGQNENGFINFNYHGSDLMKVVSIIDKSHDNKVHTKRLKWTTCLRGFGQSEVQTSLQLQRLARKMKFRLYM